MAVAPPLSGTARDAAEFELVIGGMTCAACAARVQAKLNKVDGVTATVNSATERAYVTARAGVAAADLVGVVESAGYSAELVVPELQDDGTAAADAAVRRLSRRLILALVFFVPLTDLSIMLSIFPWSRFPGWQCLLVALAAPVATWAAWPFHQAALRNARHLSSSMDTLVSLGILAACGWSVYAMFVLDRSRTGLRQPGRRSSTPPAAASTWRWPPRSPRSCWPGGCTRPGPAAAPARRCATWPRPGPGTCAC